MKKKTSLKTQKDEKLSANFFLSEFTRSATASALGIANRPGPEALATIRWVATNIAQPIRDRLGAPLNIKSGYRSEKVNSSESVGGAAGSYHLYKDFQWAFDCSAPSVSLNELVKIVREMNLPLTKAILEIDQGILHLQGIRPQYLARDVIDGKKVYVFFDDYLKKGRIA